MNDSILERNFLSSSMHRLFSEPRFRCNMELSAKIIVSSSRKHQISPVYDKDIHIDSDQRSRNKIEWL